MKKSRSVLAVNAEDSDQYLEWLWWVASFINKNKETLDPVRCSRSYTSSSTLGVDPRRGWRTFSGTLQVPQWRTRSRSPELDRFQRPSTLPLLIPPRIAITYADQEEASQRRQENVTGGRIISEKVRVKWN